MFAPLLAFELRYHTRRALFALVTLVVCGMALALVQTGYGAESAQLNSSFTVMRASGLLSLWLLFSQTLLTVSGVLRDDEHNMRELIFSRPVSRTVYFATRYLGVVLAGGIAMTLAMGVLMMAPLVLPQDAAAFDRFRAAPYLMALGTLVVPNLLLVSALLCAIAWYSRSSLATYVGGVAIFALYISAAMLGDSPLMASSTPPSAAGLARAALMDPFGISAVFEQTRYWTLAERNVRMVWLSGHYLQNRLIVLAVVAFTLLMSATRISLGIVARHRRTSVRPAASTESGTPRSYAVVAPTTSSRAQLLAAILSSVRLELRLLFGARVFQALLLLFVFITAVETFSRQLNSEYGTRILASSGEIIGAIPLRLFALLCLVYFGAELLWRERTARVNGMVDATPASNGAFVLSKLFALALVPVVLAALGLCVAALVQVTSNGLPLEPSVYLAEFWFAGYPLMLTAVMVVAAHVITGNRWAGMLVSMLVIVVAAAGPALKLEHPMLLFASAPAISHSDFDGYGAAATAFGAFMLYWTTGALLLGAISWSLWPRGIAASLPRRMSLLLHQDEPRVRGALALASVVFVCGGGLLFYHTNVLHAWESEEENLVWHADYERSYRRLAGAAQPSVTHADLALDFTPDERRADIRGTLAMRNRTDVRIDTLWLTIRREARDVHVNVRGGELVTHDARFGVYTFALSAPLLPGDSTSLDYSFAIAADGVRADGYNPDVSSNGSYVSMLVAMPSFGYRASYELRDQRERLERGLPEQSEALLSHAFIDSLTLVARQEAQPDAWLTLRAVLSTTDAHTALGPGSLRRSWNEGDRRYYEYQVESRMAARFGFVSGRYDVVRETVDGVNVEFWHHPAHGANASRFVSAAAGALRTFNERFGRYPHDDLRLIEVPKRWPFAGFALGGMLLFNERRGVLTDSRPQDVDLLTRRVAHEVAHQWWGYAVSPLDVLGATTIVETLAKYSEQMAVASAHGDSVLPQLLTYDHDRYLGGRARDPLPERPLVETSSQDYLFYGKGAVAMHALRAAMGDAAIVRALQSLIAAESGPRGAATAPLLHHLLRAEATNAADTALVDEWFTERVMYDLRADTAWSEPEVDGQRVHARFRTQRVRLAEAGETVDDGDGQRFNVVIRGEGDAVLYRGAVTSAGGTAQLSAIVAGAPLQVEIDPFVYRLDRDRSDNRAKIQKPDP